MKDKILDIVSKHCVGWKNCNELTEKLFSLNIFFVNNFTLCCVCETNKAHTGYDLKFCIECWEERNQLIKELFELHKLLAEKGEIIIGNGFYENYKILEEKINKLTQ
tara:strand:+ start:400 stop:720 length:321 start_codon:yes stop_codon:yes gene_type:complete